MKIALVTSWNVRCGIATYSQDLANALAQEDVEVYVVRLSRFGAKTPDLMVDTADRIPYDKVDLVHIQHEYGIFQGLEAPFFTSVRSHGKPIVTTMHAVGDWDKDTLISKASNKIVTHNMNCHDRFMHPSIVIPHGVISAEPTERKLAKTMLNIAKDAPVVGYLGYISNYKGLETLVTAMTKVPKAGLLICGGWFTRQSTDYINDLQNWSVKLLGKRVQFTGYIPDEKLADAYGAMDILVYPSRFATESGALLHAIGYGKAIIASNVPSFKEKEPYIMTFNDVADLAARINMLLENEEARYALELNARRYAAENSWASVAKRHVELYRNL